MRLEDDDFALFGLSPRYRIDGAGLDARWRALQAEVHPDRHAAAGGAAQRLAMQWALRVNEAYRRLKDPLRRAAYLCELRGAPIDAESNTSMPGEFLVRQMAWREALDDAGDRGAVHTLEDGVDAAERALDADIERLLDIAGDAQAAAAQVRAWMFVRRFRQELERRLEAYDA